MSKTNKKNKPVVAITPVTNKVIAAKSLASGFKAFNASVIDAAKAGVKIGSTLESIALFMLASYGVAWCCEPKSDAAKMFVKGWDGNYEKLVADAPIGDKETIANQKGVYLGRTFRWGCLLAKKQGKVFTPDQRAKADEIVDKYDSNKSRKGKKGKLEKRGYLKRLGDIAEEGYKFHMTDVDKEGTSDEKLADIGLTLERLAKLVGRSLAAIKTPTK